MSARDVLIVCGAGYVSGKEVVSLTLARGLRDLGYDVEFVASSWSDGDFVRRLDQAGFRYRCLRVGFISAALRWQPLKCTIDQMRYWPTLLIGYRRLVQARTPHAVIHTNWQHSLLLLPLLDAARDVQWVHEMVPRTKRSARVFRAIGKRTRGFVCVSRAVAQSVVDTGVPAESVTVVHNGVTVASEVPPLPNGASLRLGIVGQVAPWKGHDDILDALGIVLRGGVRATLQIFGAGEARYIASLERKIADMRLQGAVAWRGFVHDHADIYADIDVGVMPSRFEEPFGMAAIEAGAYGRPVICTARGGLVEIVDDGVTGIIVEARRPEQLARAIRTLAGDRGLVRTMGEAARARTRALFSAGQFAARFAQVIDARGRPA